MYVPFLQQNIPECNYDGGDCCACTCEDIANNECGSRGFACIDPEAACVDDDNITVDMIDKCNYDMIGEEGVCNLLQLIL